MADLATSKKMYCGVPERVTLHLAMLALQFGYAGFHVVSRAALNMGISKLVFPVYRNIIALLLLLPFAYFLEKKERPALTLSFVIQFFLLALCGITANQGFYLLGLENTSPTFASAIQNSVPAITFLMAAALRQVLRLSYNLHVAEIEQVRLNRKDGIAKLLGTLACVFGASVITLYKGPVIFGKSSLHLTYFNHPQQAQPDEAAAGLSWLMLGDAKGKSWTLGCIYLIGHCLSWSGWLVLQAPILKKYPARLSVTSFTCFFGVIQFVIIAAFLERDLEAWKFHSGGEVFTILYAVLASHPQHLGPTPHCTGRENQASLVMDEAKASSSVAVGVAHLLNGSDGFVASGIAFAVQIWCIDRGGPVFVAVYQPVQTLVVAIMASVALGEQFYLGGILGAVLIIIGLYLVLWGKSAERKFAAEAAAAAMRLPSVAAEHGITRPAAAHKGSLTQPLLPSSSENAV
ncbi:WD repeat-containing protein wat1 [Asimina triloba]